MTHGKIRYARVMGMKEDTLRDIGFARLAIFRPGIIAGNAHTPAWVAWLGTLVPGSFGNIDQRILGRSIAAEVALHGREAGEVSYENAAMKHLAAQFNKVSAVVTVPPGVVAIPVFTIDVICVSMARIDVRCSSMFALSAVPTTFEKRVRSAAT